MKKAIPLSLLLLANIIMLAHTVVPHHHHNGVIVAIFESAGKSKYENHDHDHDYDHRHESNSASEKCALNEVYTRSDESSKIVSCQNSDPIPRDIFVAPGIINKLGFAYDYGIPFRQKPFIESRHYIFLSGSIGLRAPPIC